MTPLENLVEKMFGRFYRSQSYKAEVIAVDKESNTCTIKDPESGVERKAKLAVVEGTMDVQLIVYPAIGSIVICGSLYNNEAQAFVIKVHEVDEVIWKNGAQGGMLKPQAFLDELAKTNDAVNLILETFSDWIVAPNDGGQALKTVAGQKLGGAEVGDFSSVQDDKIKL